MAISEVENEPGAAFEIGCRLPGRLRQGACGTTTLRRNGAQATGHIPCSPPILMWDDAHSDAHSSNEATATRCVPTPLSAIGSNDPSLILPGQGQLSGDPIRAR